MVESIATIIFIGSILGIIIIIFRKMPILVVLPEVSLLPTKEGLISKFGKRIKRILPFKNFSYELFLQKILAKIRILVLKIENLTFHWLQKLRESHQRKNAPKLDDYWEKIRQEIKKLKK
jgi:hypothetical protein